MGLRRTAIALTTVLAWTLIAIPAVDDDVLAADPTRSTLAKPGSVESEPKAPHLRGRVDLRDVGKKHDRSDTKGAGGPRTVDQLGLAAGESLTAAPPTVFASANATAKPTLTKLGALAPAGNSFYASVAPIVAVGPDHVVRSDQLWFRVSSRTGGSTQTFEFADLLGQPTGFDAHEGQMWFVPSVGRWLAASTSFGGFLAGNQICNLGTLDFAISDTANPLAGWTAYYYDYPNAGVIRVKLGTSSDKFAFSVQVLGDDAPPAVCGAGTPDGVDLTINEWSDVIGHSSFTSSYYFYPSTGTAGDLIVPSVGNNPNTPNLEVLANHYDASPSNRSDTLLQFSGPVPGLTVSSNNLTSSELVPAVGEALPALAASEDVYRDRSAVLHDKRLVFVGTETCTPTGDVAARNCVRLIDIDVSGGPSGATRRQDFYLAAVGADTYGPGLAFSDTGDLIVTYQRGSAGTGPSAYVVRQAPGDAANTMSAPVTLHASAGVSPNHRSAEFVGAAPDPLVPDAVWVTNNAGTSTAAPYLTQTAQARTATGDTYQAIDPLRVLDTRPGGTGLTGPFANGVPRKFGVAGAGGGAIPANAVAITGNLTVTGQGSAGYVSVGPSVSANPATSTINFPLGDNRANNLTLPLDAQGKLMAVFKGSAGKSTQLILDVTGYFVAEGSGQLYYPITTKRVVDTRTTPGGFLVTNVSRDFQVTGGATGIPVMAQAVTGNLTVVGQTRGGYVSLTQLPTNNPTTSTINFPVGDTRANGVTVPVADGYLSAVFKSTVAGHVDIIFDVTGYYLPTGLGSGGLRFYPLNPGRIMDTRTPALTQLSGAFSSSVPRTLVTGGHFGVPGDALAVTGNLTVVGQTKAGYVSITKDPTANPAVSTLNFPLGDVRANGATVPLNAANDLALVYKATSGAKTHLILDLTGYFR